uniref:NAD(P)-binding protein n=1 Tax=Schizophyllum commune (strain H4-8 / FGSC 9210) TaxID=578458 RepID=D8QLX7_SCHCM
MASILKSKCVLVTGATAGIGRALARAIRDLPSKPTVIAMGRRQERLDELAKEGFKTAKFDMNTTPDKIRAFVDDITAQYPELDAVILNAGVQYIFDFTKPESVDFNKISTEFNVNYLAVVSMMTAFLPHLIKIGVSSRACRPTLLVPVTSGLMTIPLPSTANYSATKAALHSISFSIRIQMENAKTNVHVLEIIPPLVESELHDNQGTTEALSRFWMPLADFINVVLDGLKEGKIAITAGAATSAYLQFEKGKESYRNGLMGLPVTQ